MGADERKRRNLCGHVKVSSSHCSLLWLFGWVHHQGRMREAKFLQPATRVLILFWAKARGEKAALSS